MAVERIWGESCWCGVDLVGQRTRIAHGNLLIPALVAHLLLAPEGIEAGYGDIQVGQRHGQRGVAHVLRHVGSGAERHAYAGEGGAPVDGRGTRALCQRLRIIERVEVVALIAGRGEVDACRERAVGVRLGVLAVTPLYLEALLLGEVGHALVARLGVLIAEEEGARILVALLVVAGCRDAPGALGIDFSQQLEVPLVAHGKVVAAVAEIEAAVALVTVRGHDEAAGVALREGEEAVGDGKRHRHVAHDEVGGAEDHVLARTHLGARQGDVEVGMGRVAGGVASVLQVDDA